MTDKEISLKNIIGEELLNKIQDSYLKYLESSAAIYEVNGDYAAALFASKYCDFLNQASRKLAGKTDGEALKSGRWICYEDCWATSLKSIKDKKPCEIECSGGIKIYAAPIIADDMVIGSNNAGVSNPPTDEKKIKEIAEKYKVDPKELLRIAKEYVPRPEYVSNAAKSHIAVAAEEITEIFMRKRSDEEIILHKKAEEKLRQAAEEWSRTFDAIADFLVIQDKDFKFIKVNKAFADALKMKPEELIGKKCHNLLHKSDKPWPNCPAVQTLNDKKPHTEEVIDPSIGIPLLVSTSPIFNDKDEVTAIVHYAKDITERKKREEEINRSKEYTELLIKVTPSAIFTVDASQLITSWNKKAEEITGYAAEEIIGKKCTLFAKTPCQDKCGLYSADVEKPIDAKEATIIRKDGQMRIVSKNADLLKNKNGDIIGGIESLEDITERKKLEDELRLQAVIFNNIGEGVCLVRVSDAVIVYANPKFERMFGYGEGELNGKPVNIVNYSDEKKSAEQVTEEITGKLIEKGEATYEVHNVKKNGTPFWCRATTSTFEHPVFGTVWVAVQEDIAAEKQAKEELGKAYAELENKVRERTKELQNKLEELEHFRKATIEREFRMKELRNEIERLKAEKGEK